MQQASTFEKERLEKAQIDAIGARAAVMWALLIIGFCFVAFAQSLGVYWVGQEYGSMYSRSEAALWRVGPAVLAARSIGFLLFGAGLVERVLIRFGK